MRYRFEYKYLISARTAELLRARASAVMTRDEHSSPPGVGVRTAPHGAGDTSCGVSDETSDEASCKASLKASCGVRDGGSYTVCNIYLDDRYDSFYHAKYLGHLHRDKYRVRLYNNDMSFIRLERKHKDGVRSYKDTTEITRGQYEMIMSADFGFLAGAEAPLLRQLGILHNLRTLRPAAAFSYEREAWTYSPGDVRLTLDSPPFSAQAVRLTGRPGYDPHALWFGQRAYDPLLLEVKYSGFLPAVIAGLLNGLPLTHTDMSKYCIVRERGYLTHGISGNAARIVV